MKQLLSKRFDGVENIVDRCVQEKRIGVVEKGDIQYISRTDVYKLRFIIHLLHTGVAWEDIPRYLTPSHLYSVENPGEQ